MKTEPLSLDQIRFDGGTQSRVAINQDTVEDYADILSALPPTEWPFPPLDVFFDGKEYFMSDGFHRGFGGKKAGRSSAPCVIHQGTAKDALIFGMKANNKHGLRRTPADKRYNVEWILDNCVKMLQKEIAEMAGVCERLVRLVVADRKPKLVPVDPPQSNRQRAGLQPVEGESDAQIANSHPRNTDTPPRKPPAGSTPSYGKCPNCLGLKWTEDDEGVSCAKCHHPHGEPAGDVDDDRLKIQRSKTVKTAEALMRAFDDLHDMKARVDRDGAIEECQKLMALARAW